MSEQCPTCGQPVKQQPKQRYATLAEQQAAWLAERLASHNPPDPKEAP